MCMYKCIMIIYRRAHLRHRRNQRRSHCPENLVLKDRNTLLFKVYSHTNTHREKKRTVPALESRISSMNHSV